MTSAGQDAHSGGRELVLNEYGMGKRNREKKVCWYTFPDSVSGKLIVSLDSRATE